MKIPLPLKLLLALATLGLAAFFALKHSKASWQSDFAGGRAFPSLDMDKVSSISISAGAKAATLALSGSVWTVRECDSHPADFKKVSKLLSGIAELKIARSLDDASEAELAELGLSSSKPGLEVKLFDSKGSLLASLVLGRPHLKGGSGASSQEDPDGRYCLASSPGGPSTPFLTTTLFDGVGPLPGQWLEPVRIDISKIASISSAPSKRGGESWTLLRAGPKDPFSFPGPAKDKASPKAVGELVKALSAPPIIDLIPSDPLSRAANQTCSVTLKTFDGLSYEMLFGFGSGKCAMKLTGPAPKPQDPSKPSTERTYETSLDFAGLFLAPPSGGPAN